MQYWKQINEYTIKQFKNKTMKKVKLTILMMATIAVAFTTSSCSNEKKGHDHAAMEVSDDKSDSGHDMANMQPEKLTFKDESMKEAFQHYIHVRTALTNTDANEAKNGASMLVKALAAVQGNETALAAVNIIASTVDVEAQRAAFSDLSEAMIVLAKGNIASGALYLAHCPMAMNNAGANWISSTNEIMNPYFGDKMMKCGSITETLN